MTRATLILGCALFACFAFANEAAAQPSAFPTVPVHFHLPTTDGEPVVSDAFALEELAKACDLMEAGGHFGKIAVTIP